MNKEKPIYTPDLEKTLKDLPVTLKDLKTYQTKVTGYSKISGNPIILMKKFKKHIKGGLYVGIRKGVNSSHLRVGILMRGYYTVNWPFLNCAWVLKCLEDGKLRSYQNIIAIKSEKIKEIQRQRLEYIGK